MEEEIRTLMFAEWISDKSYKRCINDEWIQLGMGDYKTVARSTRELYNIWLEEYIEEC